MLRSFVGLLARNRSTSFVKTSLTYLTGSVINSALPLLLLPVLTRYLSPTDYGIVATSTVLVQIFSAVVGINAYGLIGRTHFDEDHDVHSKLVSTSLLLAAALSAVLVLILLPMQGLIEGLTKFPGSWAAITVFLALTAVVQTTYLSILQARTEARRFISIQILSTAVNLGFSFLFVVALGMDWRGRILAIVGTALLIAVLAVRDLVARL